MARRNIPDEVRVAVQAALLAGESISETAREYHLSKSTVSAIRSGLGPDVIERVRTETRERLDDLLLDALASNLTAQKRITETVGEPDYIRQHGPSAVAELYSALSQHAVRLLEAASLGQQDADGAEHDAGEAP